MTTWLDGLKAANRVGYRDEEGLRGLLAVRGGYWRGSAPTGRALALGVVRPEGGGWLWDEAFLDLFAKACAMPDADARCATRTPHCLDADLRRAVGLLLQARPSTCHDGRAAWLSTPAARPIAGLRHDAFFDAACWRDGVAAAVALVLPSIEGLSGLCDQADPLVAEALDILRAVRSEATSIGPGHPLIAFGIVPAPEALGMAA